VTALSVCLTFDLDAETLWLGRDPEAARRPVTLSMGRYGPTEGLPRILRLLERYHLPATFFVPGQVIEWHPRACETILEAGYAIEHHTYSHAWLDTLTPEREREELERGFEVVTAFTGRRPVGFRSPAAEFSAVTVDLLEEYGFDFSSNMFDADAPYLLRNGDRVTRIVELPLAWPLIDGPYWLYSHRLPGRTIQSPSTVAETWIREYEGLVEEEDRSMMIATHPQLIGRPSRLWVLEQLVRRVLDDGRAAFVTAADLAESARPRLQAPAP
jgi:peptidoglycan/xylan/chitin deacetylase (PgdA/CDA1 family)